MALGAGHYPEAPEPSKQHLRNERELELAEEQAKEIKAQLADGTVPLQALYQFHSDYSLDDSIVEQYENEGDLTLEWAEELTADIDSCMRVLKDRLREGRWE